MSKKSKQSSTFERLFDQGKNEFPGDINKTVSPGNNIDIKICTIFI